MDAVRVGTAAGALNVTRHGLASGVREAIEAASAKVEVRPR
jgi:1-phosphofructokinase